MRIRNVIKIAAACAMLLVLSPEGVKGQSSSINTFSPYTYYGLGDIVVPGTAMNRSMGGAGAAFRSMERINLLNPASLSAMPRNRFIFSLGLEGGGYYLKSQDTKTSHNAFNFRELAMQFPIYKKLAAGLSLTPYSSVGYKSRFMVDDPEVIGQLIGVSHYNEGDGDINLAKLSMGWEPLNNFSIGVDLMYYFGNIERKYNIEIMGPVSSSGLYTPTNISQTEHVSRILWNTGIQYNLINKGSKLLTLGATFTPGGQLNPEVEKKTNNGAADTQILYNGIGAEFEMPSLFSAGIYYNSGKTQLMLDYSFQGWAGKNAALQTSGDANTVGMEFRDVHSFKAGVQYTPNRHDIRYRHRRISYRLGLRYNDYYMAFGGHNIAEKAVTLGLGIPLKLDGNSYLDLGLELGSRGTTKYGLIRENYFKVSAGVSIFTNDDAWFVKRKYD